MPISDSCAPQAEIVIHYAIKMTRRKAQASLSDLLAHSCWEYASSWLGQERKYYANRKMLSHGDGLEISELRRRLPILQITEGTGSRQPDESLMRACEPVRDWASSVSAHCCIIG